MKENAQESLIQSSYNSERLQIDNPTNLSFGLMYIGCGFFNYDSLRFTDVYEGTTIQLDSSSTGVSQNNGTERMVFHISVLDLTLLGIGLDIEENLVIRSLLEGTMGMTDGDKQFSKCVVKYKNADGKTLDETIDIMFDDLENLEVIVPAPMKNIITIDYVLGLSTLYSGYEFNKFLSRGSMLATFYCRKYSFGIFPHAFDQE